MISMYDSKDIALRIKLYAKEKNIAISEMLEKIGLSKNTMNNFKTSTPKADNLAKIADYLNCSVDYLLGRTDDPNLYIKTRYELIKNMSIQDMAAAIAEIASDCRYCDDGCSDCDGGCLSCIEDKLQAKK